MKMTSVVKSALALASLSLPSISLASPGYMANVKMALIVSEEMPGTFAREEDGDFVLDDGEKVPASEAEYYSPENTYNTEEVTQVKTTRYGNRELLEDLLAEGHFPSGVNSIQGWSLKEVSMHFGGTTFYLYKKDTTPERLDSEFYAYFTDKISKSNLKTKVRRDEPKGPVTSAKASGSSQVKGTVTLTLAGEGVDFSANASSKGTAVYIQKFVDGASSPVTLRTFKTTTLFGEGEVGEVEVYIEGSLSTSGAVLLENIEEIFEDFPLG